ncbi:MAG: PH domain-containing protein [Roseiflexus sp.]
MTTSAHSFACDLVFRPHPHIVAGKIIVLLGIGIGVLLASIVHTSALTLSAVIIVLVLALRVAYLDLATFLIVRGDTLVLRSGWIFWREKHILLHRTDVMTIQSLAGRLLDYGHITFTCDEQTIVVRNIAQFRRLQEELARLQRIPAPWRSL